MTTKTEGELQIENARLREAVKRLSYLAIDRGYGVWRCVKCDQRYTTLPDVRAVCGEVITTYTADGPRSVACHGKLEPFVYLASDELRAAPSAAVETREGDEK